MEKKGGSVDPTCSGVAIHKGVSPPQRRAYLLCGKPITASRTRHEDAALPRIFTPLRLYANFTGRASRAQFWPFSLIAWAVQTIMMIVVPPLGGLVILAMTLPLLGVLVRRLHDTNRRAWWLMPPPVLMVPLVILFACTQLMLGDEAGRKIFIAIGVILAAMIAYAIFLIVVLARRGTHGPNRFGSDPLAGVDPVSPS